MRQAPRTEKAHAFEFDDGTRREILASTIDKDDTTAFSWSPSSFGHYNRLSLGFTIVNETESGNALTLTINGVTTGDYRYREINGTTVNEQTTQSAWRLALMQGATDRFAYSGDITLTAGCLDRGAIRPSCNAELAGYYNNPLMDVGDLNATANNITQMTLSSAGNAVGRAYLVGELIGPP